MTCLNRLGGFLIPSWLLPYYFVLYILSTENACVAGDSSTKNLIYTSTLCELNVTGFQQHFGYAVETFVIFPAVTHLISLKFLTTAHLLDFLSLGVVAGGGYWHQQYVVSSIYASCALLAFIFFCCRAVRNCMSWRYKCTRFTNFVLDTKGRVFRNRSSVLVEQHGKVLLQGQPIEVKTVVLDGVKAVRAKTVPAEKWEA
nr:GP5 [Lactate dehydrogenase-elevating virus]